MSTASPPYRPPPGNEEELFALHRVRPDPVLREHLVERFLPLARHLAQRYGNAGAARDDVFQVACLALVKAVDRFDPDRGVAFSSYAVPTILGEIKRWFRDQTWAVHVSRDLQERSLRTERAVETLTRDLGRGPTVRELAASLGRAEEDVLEALEVTTAYRAASLDAPHHAGEELQTIGDTVGGEDHGLETAERRADLAALLARLAARDRVALGLRFEQDLTQAEIADVLGTSQMQVSRILRQALERLRRLAGEAHAADLIG